MERLIPFHRIFAVLIFTLAIHWEAVQPDQGQVEQNCPVLPKCRCGLHNEYVSYVYCARQNLKSIPALAEYPSASYGYRDKLLYIFDEFVLSGNLIRIINKDSFIKSIRRFRLLDLSDNPISFIDPSAFVPAKHFLRSLKLSFADKVTISRTDWLRPLRSLTYLQMENLKLDSKSIFVPNTVRQLVLQQGCFADRPVSNKVEWTNASQSNSEHPLIHFLPRDLVSFQLSHWYNLENARLTTSSPSIRLENLSLLSSGLIRVPQTWSFEGLKSLDLSFNFISSALALHAIRSQFPALDSLNIRHNQLTKEALQTSAFSNLEVITLDYNPLKELFVLPESIKELSSRYTFLRALQQTWFKHARSLITLDLQGNSNLEQEDCMALADLSQQLLALNLAYLGNENGFTIPCILKPFIESSQQVAPLQKLNIRSTGLASVPTTLKNLKHLRFLDISDNRLINVDLLSLPPTTYKLFADNISTESPTILSFETLPRDLEILSFNENDFYWLQSNQTSNMMVRLQTFIANKLLNCNCSATDLSQWLKSHSLSTVQCGRQGDLTAILNTSICHHEQTTNKSIITSWYVRMERSTIYEDVAATIGWNVSQYPDGFKGLEISATSSNAFRLDQMERRCRENPIVHGPRVSHLDHSADAMISHQAVNSYEANNSQSFLISIATACIALLTTFLLVALAIRSINIRRRHIMQSRPPYVKSKLKKNQYIRSMFTAPTKCSALDKLLGSISSSSVNQEQFTVSSSSAENQQLLGTTNSRYIPICQNCIEERRIALTHKPSIPAAAETIIRVHSDMCHSRRFNCCALSEQEQYCSHLYQELDDGRST